MLHSPTTLPAILWMSPAATVRPVSMQGARGRAEQDRRWPAMLRKLKRLRKRGRRSIRIVDTDCGAGELLIHAVRRARELGFLAIEGRGVDSDPLLLGSAKAAAAACPADPAIGLVFELGEQDAAMRAEAAFPADLLLCSASAARARDMARLARTAGDTVLCETTEGESA